MKQRLAGRASGSWCSEDAILESYGDPVRYWSDWLFHRLTPENLADLLAAHSASSENQRLHYVIVLKTALRDRDYASTREAVEWLICNPDTRGMVAPSLFPLIERDVKHSGEKPGMVAAPKNKGGRPPAADWDAVELAVQGEIQKGGWPDGDGDGGGLGWRTQADVERFVARLLSQRKEDASEGKVRSHVRQILDKLKAEKG